ncbi:MAG: MTH938/NDUFAF3 family protein, partial [Candidatus Margulisiibacteriota bacterium]
KEFGTTHLISKEEENKLISENPEIILIGIGMTGALETFPEFDEKIKSLKIKLVKQRSKQAVKTYEKLISENKKVNALIHTTC